MRLRIRVSPTPPCRAPARAAARTPASGSGRSGAGGRRGRAVALPGRPRRARQRHSPPPGGCTQRLQRHGGKRMGLNSGRACMGSVQFTTAPGGPRGDDGGAGPGSRWPCSSRTRRGRRLRRVPGLGRWGTARYRPRDRFVYSSGNPSSNRRAVTRRDAPVTDTNESTVPASAEIGRQNLLEISPARQSGTCRNVCMGRPACTSVTPWREQRCARAGRGCTVRVPRIGGTWPQDRNRPHDASG